ncbi:proton-conducting transporter membrane subunit [bacterium]|nr:proton-conducting transporter membrane subunit [bacterium]
MSKLIVLFFLIPLIAFCFSLMFLKKTRLQKIMTVTFGAAHLILSFFLLNEVVSKGELNLYSAGWSFPFGIALKLDVLSAVMLLATSLIYFCSSLYSELGKTCEKSEFYFPLLNMLFAGISGAFVASDLFNLYVWFEITLLSSFVLMGLEHNKVRLSGNLKYIIINLLSSLMFLLGIAFVYSSTGSLNFLDLEVKLLSLQTTNPEYLLMMNLILFCAFAIKSGLFPFYQWLGASYPNLSPGLSGVCAGMLTKVGLYAIFRINGLVFPTEKYIFYTLGIMAALTMVCGVLKAITQNSIRKILSFHIISQVGYIAVAAYALCSPVPGVKKLALMAGFFYAVHHIIVKTNLFFVSGIIKHCYKSESLTKLSHIRHSSPLLAVLFVLPAMSLAGIPPSSGLWAKLALFQLLLPLGSYFVIFCMIVAGFFTLFSMIKIWIGVFWGDGKDYPPMKEKLPLFPIIACGVLCFSSLVLAFFPSLLFDILETGLGMMNL